MSDWKHNLKRSCLKVGFTLHLTQPMLEYLCAVADDVQWDRHFGSYLHMPENFIATSTALERRGLIRRKSARILATLRNTRAAQFEELTPAGRTVVELVKMTGLFVESVQGAVRRMKKERRA